MNKVRVLIVDDESEICEILFEMLADEFEVLTVSDGMAAIGAMKVFRPNVVVADLLMPRMDGFHLCRELRAVITSYPIKIFVVSGTDDEVTRRCATEVGADGFLAKPFSRAELLALLHSNIN